MTIAQIYEEAKRQLDKDVITIGEFSEIVDREFQEQQPCENCISRAAAIKTVWPYVDGDLIADDIKHLPPVTPQQTRWVPLNVKGSEPPKDGKYLVCFDDGYITALYYENGEWLINIDYPIAWMPLPEPYKTECEKQYG